MVKQVRLFWIRICAIPVVRFWIAVFSQFGRHNGALLAAGLAFFLLVAFVPMLFIGIAALGYYFDLLHRAHLLHQSSDAVDSIEILLRTQILPGAAGNEIAHLMSRADVAGNVARIRTTRGMNGFIGVIGLVWASIQIYLNAAVAMNAAWGVEEGRNWFRLRLLALGLFLVSGAFLVTSIGATAYGAWLSHSRIGHLMPDWTILVNVLMEIAAAIGAAVMFALVYRYLPSAHVSWRSAFAGGAAAAVAWEVAKKGVAVYFVHPNVSLYGNLANLVLFIVWIYYSMMILLLGAEVSAQYGASHRKELQGIKPSATIDQNATPLPPSAARRRSA